MSSFLFERNLQLEKRVSLQHKMLIRAIRYLIVVHLAGCAPGSKCPERWEPTHDDCEQCWLNYFEKEVCSLSQKEKRSESPQSQTWLF